MKYENLNIAVDWIRKIKELNKDIVIAITGREQCGKSTLALKIGKKLNFDKFLDLEKQVGYDLDESLKELKSLPEDSIFVLDEAIRIAYNRAHMSSGNQQVNVLMRQIGSKRCTIFAVMPNFWEMDSGLRDRRVALWIHCLGPSLIDRATKIPMRFEAVMFEPNEHAFDRDKWGLEFEKNRITKARRKGSPFHISLTTGLDEQLRLYRKMSGYCKHFCYAPLPDDYFNRYKKMSNERKFEDNQDPDKHSTQLVKTKLQRNKSWCLMHNKFHMSAEEIAEQDGTVSGRHVRRVLQNTKGLSYDCRTPDTQNQQ